MSLPNDGWWHREEIRTAAAVRRFVRWRLLVNPHAPDRDCDLLVAGMEPEQAERLIKHCRLNLPGLPEGF